MRYTVETIRAHDDEKYQWKFIVRGPSIKHKDYGRVFSYVLNDAGQIRVFDTEGDAWACAAAVNRGETPNDEVRGASRLAGEASASTVVLAGTTGRKEEA